MRITLPLRAIPALSLLALGACGMDRANVGAPPPPAVSAETVTIAVGPCFGFCPVYDATIAPDGGVTFEGKRHTAMIGVQRRSAGPATYAALARDLAPFRPADGSTAQVACETMISDTSSYTITWTDAAGRTTTATHQRGCSAGAGRALDAVLGTVPQRLGITDWAKQVTRPGASRG